LINEELIYSRFVGSDYFEQQPIGRTVGRRTSPREFPIVPLLSLSVTVHNAAHVA
jgi:hypothetical protein